MGGNACFCRASRHDILQLFAIYITLGVMKPLQYQGCVFDSITALYRAVQPTAVSYACFRRRLASGWGLEKAITTPVASSEVKPIEYHGLTFDTVMELYKTVRPPDMSYMCLRNRLASGWDIEKALNTPVLAAWRRTYTVDGKLFDSLKALADAAGISYMSAVKRAQRGLSDDEIFYGPTKRTSVTAPKTEPKDRGIPVTIAGIKYQNLQRAYDSLKPSITLNAAKQRIRRGQSIEDAFLLTGRPDGRTTKVEDRNLTINGAKFTSQQAAKAFGVPLSTVRDRKARGASDEQAVGLAAISSGQLLRQREAYTDRKPTNQQSITVRGVTYKTVSELARTYGLSHALVYHRIRKYGWDPEKAVTEPVAAEVIVDGIAYRSAQAAWEIIGETSFSLFSARRTEELDIRVCLGIDPLPLKERYEYKGVTYPNLDELSAACGLTPGQLAGRLRTMTIEEAVNYRPIYGRYTPAKFRADPELAARNASLYFVRLQAKDGELHKIGITTRTTHARFYRSSHKIIALWTGRLDRLYLIEQEIIDEFSANHYRAEEEFDGRTETFIFLPDEEAKVIQRITEKMSLEDFA